MQRIGFDNNVLKKKMRPTIFLALLYVPLLWFFAFLFVGFFFPSALIWFDNNPSFDISSSYGTLAVLLSTLSSKIRKDYKDDFENKWEKHYTDYTEIND